MTLLKAPPDRPEVYEGTAQERIRQLTDSLPSVRSVWFPTPRELRVWSQSGLGLYVRRIGANVVEVGPRLPSMWAACFSPVEVLTFVDGEIQWTRRFPRFTAGLLGFWWLLVFAWGVNGIPQVIRGEQPPAWLVFFGMLAGAALLGPVIGWTFGGEHLDRHRSQLVATLTVNDSGEDW